MPAIAINTDDLKRFGNRWTVREGSLSRTPPESSSQLGELFDKAVGSALATMLGGLPIAAPTRKSLTPAKPNCVEVGPALIVGGVRPQHFDVGYRPDGVRFAFDSKTLNDTKSVAKNYQNMINDLATEATTVHSRFPYSLVAFMVIVPKPCLVQPQSSALIGTLERLTGRWAVADPSHLAEAISLVVWNPTTGTIDPRIPSQRSPLRIEVFSSQVEHVYKARYKGLPPHDEIGKEAEETEVEKKESGV